MLLPLEHIANCFRPTEPIHNLLDREVFGPSLCHVTRRLSRNFVTVRGFPKRIPVLSM